MSGGYVCPIFNKYGKKALILLTLKCWLLLYCADYNQHKLNNFQFCGHLTAYQIYGGRGQNKVVGDKLNYLFEITYIKTVFLH